MPYKSPDDLPPAVKDHLPPHAAETWRQAYNAAHTQYDGDESRAAATAWAAVKNTYERGKDGQWHRKAEPATARETAARYVNPFDTGRPRQRP